eukprot:6393327-Pyramimonas_sp.AAC.1
MLNFENTCFNRALFTKPSIGTFRASWAPAVNRQPGYRQGPRRVSYIQKSTWSMSLKTRSNLFGGFNRKSVPPSVLIVL